MIFDRLMQIPADADPWIVDHQPIIIRPDDERIAPSAVADRTARAATVLRDRGVTAGRRCIVWVESPTDVIVAYTAVTALDAVPILISTTLPADTLRAMVTDVPDITTIIATGHRLAEGADLLPGITPVDWAEVAAEAPAAKRFTRPKERPTDAAYVVVHTSGTTSIPKLVECSGRSIRFNASVQAVIHWAARLRGYLAAAISPVHGRTVVGVLAALMRHAPLILLADESPESVERILKRHRPGYLEAHPNTFRAWQHLAPGGAFKSVRFFGLGFDVIHPDTVRALLGGSKYRAAMFVEVYGQNEGGPISIRCHFKGLLGNRRKSIAHLMRGHSVGIRFFFCRVRILDDAGRPVPYGTPGRIVVRSPGLFTRYLNRPVLSSRTFPQGRWWDTGDWGALNRFGGLTLVDRQVDRVSSVPSTIAIEDILLEQFPELLELVVVEVDGALRPVLSLRPGTELPQQEWAAAQRPLAELAAPWIIPDHDFPRTSTGKVQRTLVKDMVHDRALAARADR